MTKLIRHTMLLLAASLLVVGCEGRAIPSDTMGTDGIKQGVIAYDTIQNMRELIPADTIAEPENPIDTISVDEAVRIGMEEVASGASSDKSYYVLGYVKGYYNLDKNPFDPNYGNICVTLTNKLNNRSFVCYRMLSFNGNKFDSISQVQPGDVIVAYGKIQHYNSSPQMPQGCQLVTSDNPNSGYKPAPRVVMNITFNNNIGAFSIDTKKAASEDVWQHIAPTADKPGYMNATAKINSQNEESESWLVSPARDLTVCKKGAILSFNHYCFGTSDDRDQLIRLFIKKEGSSYWQQLAIPEEMWNNPKQKRLTNVSLDISEFISPATQIAFAYRSTTENAHTWAVQNVRISEPAESEE